METSSTVSAPPNFGVSWYTDASFAKPVDRKVSGFNQLTTDFLAIRQSSGRDLGGEGEGAIALQTLDRATRSFAQNKSNKQCYVHETLALPPLRNLAKRPPLL